MCGCVCVRACARERVCVATITQGVRASENTQERRPRICAPLRSAPLRSAPLRSAPLPSAPLGSAPLPCPLLCSPLPSVPSRSPPLPSLALPSAPLRFAPLRSDPVRSLALLCHPLPCPPLRSAPLRSSPHPLRRCVVHVDMIPAQHPTPKQSISRRVRTQETTIPSLIRLGIISPERQLAWEKRVHVLCVCASVTVHVRMRLRESMCARTSVREKASVG